MTEFVKKCFVWQLRKRVNCDLTPAGLCGQVSYVALNFCSQLSAANQQTQTPHKFKAHHMTRNVMELGEKRVKQEELGER